MQDNIDCYCDQDYNEVKDAFNSILETHAKGDVEGLIALFAPNDDIVLYGTGESERYTGIKEISEALRKSFKEVESIKIVTPWVRISGKGPVAWVNADCDCTVVAQGSESKFPARMTVVYLNLSGQWKIVSSHFSLPASEEPYDMEKYQQGK